MLALSLVSTVPTVLSAPSAPAAALTGTTQVPETIVVVGVSLAILQVIGFVGKHISFVAKWDNIIRIGIVALGIAIPLSVAPWTGDILTIFETLVKAGTSNTDIQNWAFAGLSAVSLLLAFFGAWIIYKSPTHKLSRNALIGAFLLAGVILGLPWVQAASAWFVTNVEIGFFWKFFLGIYDFGYTHHFRLTSS